MSVATRETAGQPTEASSTRWLWGAAIAILAIHATLAWVSRIPGIGYSNDDSIYLFLARSLREGSYRDIHLPGAPLHVQYPPGWPALLALGTLVVGERPEILLVIPLALAVAGLALFFDIIRRSFSPGVALVTLALAALNPLVVGRGGRLMSEASMFFFAVLALWALAVPQPSRRRLVLACVAAIASAFMRSAGIAVIGAVLVHFLMGRRWRWAFGFALVAAITFGPWLAWSFLGPRQVIGRSYAGDLAAVDSIRAVNHRWNPSRARLLGMAYRTERYLLGHVPAVMSFPVSNRTRLDNVAWLLLLLGVGVPGLVMLWRRQRVVALYLLATFGVLVAWTWSSRRFLYPVMPMIILGFVAGAAMIGRRFGRAGAWLGPLLLCLILLPRTARELAELVRTGWDCDRARPLATCFPAAQQAFLEAAQFSRSLADSSIVVVEREAAFAWHSGRKVTHSREVDDAGAPFLAYLRDRQITHIVIGRLSMNERVGLANRLNSICRNLELVRDFGSDTYLFRVDLAADSSASGGPPTAACQVTDRLDRVGQRIREQIDRGGGDEEPTS